MRIVVQQLNIVYKHFSFIICVKWTRFREFRYSRDLVPAHSTRDRVGRKGRSIRENRTLQVVGGQTREGDHDREVWVRVHAPFSAVLTLIRTRTKKTGFKSTMTSLS